VFYLTLCEEVSIFTTSRVTQHLLTNFWVMSLFRAFTYSVDGEIGRPGRVTIH
jgi:RNA 3'-terminal phosphate cyclase